MNLEDEVELNLLNNEPKTNYTIGIEDVLEDKGSDKVENSANSDKPKRMIKEQIYTKGVEMNKVKTPETVEIAISDEKIKELANFESNEIKKESFNTSNQEKLSNSFNVSTNPPISLSGNINLKRPLVYEITRDLHNPTNETNQLSNKNLIIQNENTTLLVNLISNDNKTEYNIIGITELNSITDIPINKSGLDNKTIINFTDFNNTADILYESDNNQTEYYDLITELIPENNTILNDFNIKNQTKFDSIPLENENNSFNLNNKTQTELKISNIFNETTLVNTQPINVTEPFEMTEKIENISDNFTEENLFDLNTKPNTFYESDNNQTEYYNSFTESIPENNTIVNSSLETKNDFLNLTESNLENTTDNNLFTEYKNNTTEKLDSVDESQSDFYDSVSDEENTTNDLINTTLSEITTETSSNKSIELIKPDESNYKLTVVKNKSLEEDFSFNQRNKFIPDFSNQINSTNLIYPIDNTNLTIGSNQTVSSVESNNINILFLAFGVFCPILIISFLGCLFYKCYKRNRRHNYDLTKGESIEMDTRNEVRFNEI